MNEILLLGRAEVARLLNVALGTFDGLHYRGEFPAGIRLGKRVFWPRFAVEEFIARKFEEAQAAVA